MSQTKYYAENTAVFLAKGTIYRFIEQWAKNRNPNKQERFAFFCGSLLVAYDKQGNKTLDGHPVGEFFRHIEEAHAKQLLRDRPYLKKGLCSWAELWEAYCERYRQ